MTQTLNVGSRSLFVTIIAWVFIVLALLASASALVQNAAVSSLPGQIALAGTPLPQPGLTGWLLGYLPWVVGAGLVVSVATLAAAVGLLLRLEWARRTFIGLLLVAIAANLAGLWLQQEVMLSLVDVTLQRAALPAHVASVFGGFVVAARSMAVLVTLAGCALLGWIAWRLTQPLIRQEFA
ncbi:MAG: hypothetical protein JNL87_12755 [Burkholderiaceae bacterium]|nr:hypothetical protein [Burkholderiaceae bacterium]